MTRCDMTTGSLTLNSTGYAPLTTTEAGPSLQTDFYKTMLIRAREGMSLFSAPGDAGSAFESLDTTGILKLMFPDSFRPITEVYGGGETSAASSLGSLGFVDPESLEALEMLTGSNPVEAIEGNRTWQALLDTLASLNMPSQPSFDLMM